jgi:hypothetical protein
VIHRFFDTSSISPSGKYVTLFRFPDETRLPKPDVVGEVILVVLKSRKERVVALSRGWEMQLGVNVQWVRTDKELYFNDFDTATWKGFAGQLNPLTGKSVRMGGTVFMVSPDVKQLASHNLTKSRYAQVGYGVVVPDKYTSRNKGLVDNNGICVTNVAVGKCKMIVSICQIYEKSIPSIAVANPNDYEYYCFQVKWNPQGTRLLTVIDWLPKQNGQRQRVVVTMRPDGSEIKTALTNEQWIKGGRHINRTPDGECLSMNLNVDGKTGIEIVTVKYDGIYMKRTCLLKNTNTDEQNTCEFHLVEISFNNRIFDPKDIQQVKCFVRMKTVYPAGFRHPSFHSTGLPFIVTDAYAGEIPLPDSKTPIRLIIVESQTEQYIAEIILPPIKNFEFRVDAHPAWDRTGRYVVFNGTDNGTRCVYVADLKNLLKH